MAEYIKKQAAVEIAMQYCPDDDGSCSRAGEDIRDLLDELENIPPADVRPVRRGRWVPVTNGRGGHECSECHEYAPSYQSGNEYLSKFCPNCGSYNGADMRGGDAE